MKKVLICGVIAAAFGVTSAMAAGTGSDTFTVKATLASTCIAKNPATAVVDFGNVTAFGAVQNPTATAHVVFSCTQGLTPAASLPVASGTVSGLTYALTVTSAGAKATGNGTIGDDFDFTVTGTMAPNQAGNTADPASKTHTLTIAF